MKAKLAVLISVALIFCLASGAVAEEKKTIKMGVLQWNDLVCPSLVTKKLMEKHYG